MVKRILFLLVISSALQSMVTAAEEPSINLEVARELFSRSGMFRIGSALDTVSFAAPFPLCKNALYDCDEFSRKYIARADEPVNLRSLCCALEKAHRSLCYRKEGSIFWGVADTCLRIRSGEIETRQCLYARCIDESFVIVALDNAEIVRECACYDAKKMRTDFWVESWYFVVHQDSDLLLRSLFGEEDIEATACGEDRKSVV